LASACLPSAAAQEIQISASVDKETVSLNDQILLYVQISGNSNNIPEPEMPSLPNFSLYSSGRSQNFSMVNGQVSASLQYNYVLVPRFVGKSEIGPIAVKVSGKVFQTAPMTITVLRPNAAAPPAPPGTRSSAQGAAAPPAPPGTRPPAGGKGRVEPQSGVSSSPRPSGAPGSQGAAPGVAPAQGQQPPLFAAAAVDKKKAYVNEQVMLTVRFHTSVNLLGNPEYVPPDLSGFFSEDLPPVRTYRADIGGRPYLVMEVKTALFSSTPGAKTISPATVRCQVQRPSDFDPFAADFFQQFFSGGAYAARTQEIKSDPVTLLIEPLPESGKPAGFSGAVGKYRLVAALDKKELNVGDAVNLSLTVEGQGNLKTVFGPKLPELPAFRGFDTVHSINLNKADDIVQGSKTFKTVMVARNSGLIEFPEIPFSYFDPEQRRYASLRSAAMKVTVRPGAHPPGASVSAGATAPASITPGAEDIHFIKEKPGSAALAETLASLAAPRRAHAAAAGVLFAANLLLAGWARWRNKNPVKLRARQAYAKAAAGIDAARRLREREGAAEILAESLRGYLADKLNLPGHGLTWKEISSAVLKRNPRCPADKLQRLKEAWESLDSLRFAPPEDGPASADGGVAGSPMAAELKEILGEMEKVIR
ncbi:MAG: protein BatD, partial [Elusimicrobia bacterium]|nr:protein BatD [Elusimicrobiota bacterium]